MAEDIPDLPVSGSVSQAYRETLARLDELAKERDEARAAGRELVAENATLRADRDWWRAAARQLAGDVMRTLAEFDAAVAENARGGVLGRGKGREGAE